MIIALQKTLVINYDFNGARRYLRYERKATHWNGTSETIQKKGHIKHFLTESISTFEDV